MRMTGNWTRKARLIAALGSAAMAAAAACSGAHAQSVAFIEQVGDRNETSITQRGENNSAAVTIKGSDNGAGVVSSQTRSLVAYNRQSFFGVTLPITSPRSGPATSTRRHLIVSLAISESMARPSGSSSASPTAHCSASAASSA